MFPCLRECSKTIPSRKGIWGSLYEPLKSNLRSVMKFWRIGLLLSETGEVIPLSREQHENEGTHWTLLLDSSLEMNRWMAKGHATEVHGLAGSWLTNAEAPKEGRLCIRLMALTMLASGAFPRWQSNHGRAAWWVPLVKGWPNSHVIMPVGGASH